MIRSPTLRMLLACAVLAQAGCSMIPAYHRPESPVPDAFESAAETTPEAQPVSADWWTRFGSAPLDDYMREALAANLDLAAATRRIDQARAQLTIAGGPLAPSLDATGSASRRRDGSGSSGDDGFFLRSNDETDYQGLLTMSYELDLWGKNAAAVQAADARLTGSVYDRDAIALVLQSDLAAIYFDALATNARLRIARENLTAAREVLELIEARYNAGGASALELAQQRTDVASQEAGIPPLEQQLRADEYAIAVLLGQGPTGFRIENAELHAITLPAIAPEQPSTLLARRPDVALAESELLAANAEVGVARAELLPSVSVNLSTGFASAATGGVSSLALLAAQIVAPLYRGGALRGNVELSEARYAELVEIYRKAVLTALQETENAFVAVQKSAARATALADAAEAAREAYQIARIQYEAGAVDFLTVLDAQRTALSTEDGFVQAELDRYTAAVNLFKALGGGWQPAAMESASTQ